MELFCAPTPVKNAGTHTSALAYVKLRQPPAGRLQRCAMAVVGKMLHKKARIVIFGTHELP
jgi:hypothetical protein